MGKGGDTAKGAAGGAITGASAGAVAGPWGAVIGGAAGGVIGGIGGYFGSDDGGGTEWNDKYNLPHYNTMYNSYGRAASRYGTRDAPQSQAAYGASGRFRNDQINFGRQLSAEAQGRGIGQRLVRQQSQNIADRGLAQQYGMASAARPGMGAAAYQNAAMNGANMQAQVGGQAALAGGQMQLGAMQQYGGFLSGARGQDMDMSKFNAGQTQQNNQFNVGARQNQMSINDQAQLEAWGQRLAASQMQQAGGLAYNTGQNGYAQGMIGQPTDTQRMMGAIGGAAQGYFQYKQAQNGASGGGGYNGGYNYSGGGASGADFDPYNY